MTTALCPRALRQSFAAIRLGARLANVSCRTSSYGLYPSCRQRPAPLPRAQRRWNHQNPWPLASRDQVELWFDTLGLPLNASPRQIREAHRGLAFKYNTDQRHNKTASKEKFQEVNAARDGLAQMMKPENSILFQAYIDELRAIRRKKAAAAQPPRSPPGPNVADEMRRKWEADEAKYKAWTAAQEAAAKEAAANKDKLRAAHGSRQRPTTETPKQSGPGPSSSTSQQGTRQAQPNGNMDPQSAGVRPDATPDQTAKTSTDHSHASSKEEQTTRSGTSAKEGGRAESTSRPGDRKSNGPSQPGEADASQTERPIAKQIKPELNAINPRVVLLRGLSDILEVDVLRGIQTKFRPGAIVEVKMVSNGAKIEFGTADGAANLQRLGKAGNLTIKGQKVTQISLHNSPLPPPPAHTGPNLNCLSWSRVLLVDCPAGKQSLCYQYLTERKLRRLFRKHGVIQPVVGAESVMLGHLGLTFASWRSGSGPAKEFIEKNLPDLRVDFRPDPCSRTIQNLLINFMLAPIRAYQSWPQIWWLKLAWLGFMVYAVGCCMNLLIKFFWPKALKEQVGKQSSTRVDVNKGAAS